ncbi:PREDICTED: epimerase family protein SDR39U1 isoform X1 [Rhagoletis zephyria]|uniref:epimerase family protein SDR39U1 isoform X1 n=2 Tax=Rhagoletis zephyria TaxID=28612 RepID=UPI0008117D3C|nr:PREDICTED: epimerase family protein SDR39U1 isoform X1 [Rhagoletis zephyria]
MSRHALIGGGTGFIGNGLSKCLTKNGYDVTVISRMPGLKRITWLELERSGIPNNVTAVVNLAGQNVLDPSRRWTDGFKQNVWTSRINTSVALAKAIGAAPQVKAFVNVSGVSHYKPDDKHVYNENDSVQGFDYMSKLCLEWEKAATLPPDVTHCRNIKIRTGVVIGRTGGMIENIWLPFQLGLGGPIGSGKQILPWIHLDDLCQLVVHAIENDKIEGILNGVAPEIVTNGEFSKAFASALRRPCLFAVPELVIETIFGKDRSALLLSGAKIQPKRTLETGFKFKYPTAKEACLEVVKKS